MFQIKFSGENFKDVFSKIKSFVELFDVEIIPPVPEKAKVPVAPIKKGRRKMTAGEHLGFDVALGEVKEAFKQVSENKLLGKSYVDIILGRIPAVSVEKLSPAEYGRVIRLCRYYLDQAETLSPSPSPRPA